MFKNLFASLSSTVRELDDAQKKIDATARKLVEGVARMVDVASDEAPSSRTALPDHDFGWYTQVAATLAGSGFGEPYGVESQASMTRPTENRVLSEYALGEGGTLIAQWFQMRPRNGAPGSRILVFNSVFQDGHEYTTIQNASVTALPSAPASHTKYVDGDGPIEEFLAHHRTRIAGHGAQLRSFDDVPAFQRWQAESSERTARYRREQGLALVEHYIAARYTGEKQRMGEEYLQCVRRHPEWYKYSAAAPVTPPTPNFMEIMRDTVEKLNAVRQQAREAGAPPSEGGAPAPPRAPAASPTAARAMPLNFMVSPTDDGRRLLTTFGMMFTGLPELMLTDLAANHCRAGRILAGTVAAALARRRSAADGATEYLAQLVSEKGARLAISRADAVAARVTGAEDGPDGGVTVHLSLRGFTREDEPSMLHIDPMPGTAGSSDERLRDACARLGIEVPVARGQETGKQALHEAHLQAVARLPEIRARWEARGVSGEKLMVKSRATRDDVGEYIWMEVQGWRDDTIDGEAITPAPRVGIVLGQRVSISTSEVYDQMILGPTGPAVPALTDVVATDYGMDV